VADGAKVDVTYGKFKEEPLAAQPLMKNYSGIDEVTINNLMRSYSRVKTEQFLQFVYSDVNHNQLTAILIIVIFVVCVPPDSRRALMDNFYELHGVKSTY
jgi:hypothetical protein